MPSIVASVVVWFLLGKPVGSPTGQPEITKDNDSLTQQQKELNQTHRTEKHSNTVNLTNDCQQVNRRKRKQEERQSPCTKKRTGVTHTTHGTHEPPPTPEVERTVAARSAAQNTTHIDRARRATNERKKRQSETMHENPRKRKK